MKNNYSGIIVLAVLALVFACVILVGAGWTDIIRELR